MFVCNSDGVYMPALRPAGTYDPSEDPRDLQVRARRSRDLTALREHWLPELGPAIRLPHTDYEYRAYCTRAQWGQALALMAQSIDYEKFKDTARDSQLHDLYLSIWFTIRDHLSHDGLRNRWTPARHRKVGKKARRKARDTDASLWSDEDWAAVLGPTDRRVM